MIFKASLDKTCRVVTALISVVFLVIIALQLSTFFEYRSWPSLAISLLLVCLYGLTYLYRPVNYRIDKHNIIVHRPASDVAIPRHDVKKVELLNTKMLKGSIRTFGVGGLFGYFGQFMNSQMGCMTWYATRHRKKAVLIVLNNDKKIILTPDEPEFFVEQVTTIAA